MAPGNWNGHNHGGLHTGTGKYQHGGVYSTNGFRKKTVPHRKFTVGKRVAFIGRHKDFQGLNSNGFDKFGNFSFGIKEHIIFPEINFEKVDRIRGMDITIVTNGKEKEITMALLEAANFPFTKKEQKKGIKNN